MTDRLAGLVLPDATPVEDVRADTSAAPRKERKRHALARLPALAAGFAVLGRGDWLLAAGGFALAGACALFPWYIFFNQDQFGVRPLSLSGETTAAASGLAEDDASLAMEAMPQLDFFPTGTVPQAPEHQPDTPPPQPYPGDRQAFRFIHLENGEAMIEDEDGFWIVRPGSPLPDGSRLARIERRRGTWLLVTSEEGEIALSR
ncbi:hypothetical protein [Chelativorans sp. AA-79]|uniref:hypothetical protein n=1 Tax=Chelativorans sp. AA-79 TaxID=3028735 RepID=UPI0023F8F81C|nr:hypothetical protein [Chelativorans sp. AA-79]WEX08304.1 hypothetical protein PVE73_19815 [Chelativorans sp. AA-79]